MLVLEIIVVQGIFYLFFVLMIRNWLLQGANDMEALNSAYPNPREDPAWTTLSVHQNDATLNEGYQSHTWEVENKEQKFFRFFRY